MIRDVELIVVGCVVLGCAYILDLRTVPGRRVDFRIFGRLTDSPPRSRVLEVLVGAGVVVAVIGGTHAQKSIGSWAVAATFVPLIGTRLAVIAVHNRRIRAGGDAPSPE